MSNHYGAIQGNSETTQAVNIRRKEGAVFLGCCDMRRAVIILDTIYLVILVIQMLLYIDMVRSEQPDREIEVAARSLLRICVMEALLVLISLWGALSFSMGMVFAGIVNFGVGLAAGFALMRLPAIVLNLVFVAPHVLLFMEIQRGIMTEATYQNEEHSCCCL
ncbi:unnamed protein product [Cylindrotheca closterium]|uniref:Uncharacterized protein n=1 Tax=Cylindrotheca closterium TaxID=2856 RepID=A0AAD2CPZ5_9STRA|nr:unnamed protein product [Cylindrotheca closterium]